MRQRVTLQLPKKPLTAQPLRGSVLLVGYGFVAKALRPALEAQGLHVRWTSREPEDGEIKFGSEAMRQAFAEADYVVISVPTFRDGGDPTLEALSSQATKARWIGYLSATSVYGDRNGQWAYEGEAPTPMLNRGKRRAKAELAWLETYPQTQIFRLAGIYGPGRSPFKKLRSGNARVVEMDGHTTNRIHVEDIVSALLLSMTYPSPQDIYNLADGHPAPSGDVLDYAAELIGETKPPRVTLDDPSLSDMARSFYAETKRVDTSRARLRLNWSPAYPTFREGLQATLKAERN